jgi:adenylate cyclase
VRITAQLIDAATGGHLWAERYDRDLTDIFAVQDEVTLSIVDALKVALTPAEQTRITDTGTSNLDAHDAYMRARSLILSPNINAEVFLRGVECCERAIELDPNYAQAYALLGASNVMDHANRWSDDPEGALARGERLTARSVELDPRDPYAHHAVALLAIWSRKHELAAAAVEKALALDPNLAHALFTRGNIAIFSGRPKDAIPDIEHAMRLDPGFSQQHLHFLGLAHLLLGNDETAGLMFRERLLLATDTDVGRAMLAAALGHLGEIEEAQRLWGDLKKINPSFSIQERIDRLPFANRSDANRIFEGLAKAGLPD